MCRIVRCSVTPSDSAALRHEIPIAIIDPLPFAEVDGRRVVLTGVLDRDRANLRFLML